MWILYIMLFVAPPGPHMAESKKVWALQSATAMDFETQTACEKAYGDILDGIRKTDTVTARAWCFPKGPSSEAKGLVPEQPTPPSVQLPIKP